MSHLFSWFPRHVSSNACVCVSLPPLLGFIYFLFLVSLFFFLPPLLISALLSFLWLLTSHLLVSPPSPLLVFSPHVWAVSSSSVLSSPLLLTSPSFFLSPDSTLSSSPLLFLSPLISLYPLLSPPLPSPFFACLCLLSSFSPFPLLAPLPVFLFCLLTSSSYRLFSHPATKAQRSVIEEHLQAQGSRHNTPNSLCWGRSPESDGEN